MKMNSKSYDYNPFYQHERQAEKDEVVQMTDKLDDQWRVLHNVVAARKVKVRHWKNE